MFKPFDKTRQLDALLKYMSARLILNEELTRLEDDMVWKALMASPEAAQARMFWTIDKLLTYPEESKSTKVEQKPAAPGSKTSAVLVAPTNLMITTTRRIEPLHRMAAALALLGNDETLTLARRYSARADRTIYDWLSVRTRLLNETFTRDNSKIVDVPAESLAGANLAQNVSRDEQTKRTTLKLTFPQLHELTNFAPPALSEAEVLLKEQTSVTLPSLGIPIGLIEGAYIVEVGILLSLIYFWVYYREARRSPQFPAEATLFGVFARTRLTRFVFFCLLTLPPIAGAILAEKSFGIAREHVVIAALIGVFAILIQLAGPLPSMGTAAIRSAGARTLPTA